ncbi:MAG: helix-turn-helix transcriptional regulator [Candidatus Poribacteria bacterium]|nr:helix-turn-helix transcriptional regulator [Candidatus Poribacteria bacterium]
MKSLRQLRNYAGLNQTELGARAGLCASDISRIERGHVRPSLRAINGLARALGVEPEAVEELAEALAHPSRRTARREAGA